jgi:hypothetical protein
MRWQNILKERKWQIGFALGGIGILFLLLYEPVKKFFLKVKPNPKYLDIYKKASEQTGLPFEFIVAHAHVESRQNHLAVGKLGEYGLWQFLPSTWTTLMGNVDWKDPNNQLIAYVKHSNNILKKYNLNPQNKEDLKKFLWIWNAGSGNYEKGILPKITQAYINNVLSIIVV